MEGFNTIIGFSTIEEVLDELRQGKIVLVTDDENRENEGDFICAAQHATTEFHGSARQRPYLHAHEPGTVYKA